ncbi:MAG TPA: phytanoyl-CoA dioxygenase family protein [Xanthomonadales bacterium]|nr:phytanoyl-CoA dioxygenase family protein [Xanthomonadales bacterium]
MHGKSLKDDYEKNGYAVIEGAFSASSLASIRAAALHIVEEFDIDRHRSVFSTRDRDQGRDEYFSSSSEAIHCFLEQDALDEQGQLVRAKTLAINKIGHALHDLDPAFDAFCRQPMVSRTLREIGYADPLLWQTMYIFKQPRIGGEVRWHQDASYLIAEPGPVVGFWVAVEDAHRDNGCLWVQPGGHRSALRDIYEYDHVARRGELRSIGGWPWPGEEEAVAVEVPAGSLVIFHDHMPHYSSQNRSDHSRHAFTMHFADASSHWHEKNWLQRPRLGAYRV